MTDNQDPKPTQTHNLPQSSSKISGNIGSGSAGYKFQNPPESVNPDVATMRDQWRYAIRQYSKSYSMAWGSAILAGVSFFALGWVIKGSNPLPSFKSDNDKKINSDTNPHQAQ